MIERHHIDLDILKAKIREKVDNDQVTVKVLKLMENKADYDEERRREWKERQAMKSEDQALRRYFLAENSSKESQRMEDEAREIREAELNAKWQKRMLETEIEK